MERVQFQQEQMLDELKDFVAKGVFTQEEIKSIMRKRTAFETALVRRVPVKADFLRYITYEADLEQLRRKRVKRLKLPPAPPSVSDYALVRRQYGIYERALLKFKGDVGLWTDYIQLAHREGAPQRANRACARALQMHPHEPKLWVLAAAYSEGAEAQRAMLQRGLRMNETSVLLWVEYCKFELGFVERLRRRWDVLGVEETSVDRLAVMEGGVVEKVIEGAFKVLEGNVELEQELRTLVASFPAPDKFLARMLACIDRCSIDSSSSS